VIIDVDTAAEADSRRFTDFVAAVEPRLRRALVATCGAEAGREATAEALAWAWEHRDRVYGLDAPVAYLYRVGRSRSRRGKVRFFTERVVWTDPWVEPALAGALSRLNERQRVAVLLVYAHGWTSTEVAELLGVPAATVRTRAKRGLAALSAALKGDENHD